MLQIKTSYDAIVIGGGVSGAVISEGLVSKGLQVLVLEAGNFFYTQTFPRKEIDANSQMYWNGGVELTADVGLALVRPKVVGGGSIINGGLLDRFDDTALDDFRSDSGISFFNSKQMSDYYDAVAKDTAINKISEKFSNGNGKIFKKGFESNGYKCAPLDRGQSDCEYEKGTNCIECLMGCPTNSKQSTMTTYIRKALKKGLKIFSQFEVSEIIPGEVNRVIGKSKNGEIFIFHAPKIIMAAGAIGNTKLLMNSGFSRKIPNLGHNFYTHPQYMFLGLFKEPMMSYKGPLQSYKSADPNFRKKGFKLENVFAPPVAISLLVNGYGKSHLDYMSKINYMGCIEVAIRDTNPGQILVGKNNKTIVKKVLNSTDKKRKSDGVEAIMNIMHSVGAENIQEGGFGIGLHLMGGCSIGADSSKSVVNPEFQLHEYKNIYCADSSIFPNAPGINPALSIMAFSKLALEYLE